MKKTILTLMAASVAVTAVLAGPRGGIQAVVFPKWNSTSVNNLVAAVNEAAPESFELSQCPFFGGTGRWNNTIAFIQGVNGNVRVVAAFFLSFHSDQPGYDLARRAANLNTFLVNPRAELGGLAPVERITYLVLSPQLEDKFTDSEWKAQMQIILDKLDEAKVLRSGKLRLRRSIMKYSSSLSRLEYQRGGKYYTFAVVVEHHKVSSVPASGIWSNDGDFVYREFTLDNLKEDSTSMVDRVHPDFKKLALADFVEKARARSGPVTLWRSAYNVWRREVANGKVRWIRDGNLPKPWDRVDSNTTFDEREKRALKQFLNGLK
jgi:hypothetical protein